MNIGKIEIKNFRSLEEVSIIFKNNLMCIVGRNDVGKSTVIKAMETFFSKRAFEGDDFPFKSTEDTVSEIIVHFQNNHEDLEVYTENRTMVICQSFTRNGSKIDKCVSCLKEFEVPSTSQLSSYSKLKKTGTDIGVEFPKNKPDADNEIKELERKVLVKIEEFKGKEHWVDISKDWPNIKKYLPEIITIPAVQDPESEQKMTSDSSAFGSLFRVGIRKLLQYDSDGQQAISTLQSKMTSVNDDILRIVEEKLKTQGNNFSLSQTASPLDVSKSFSFQMDIADEHGVKTPLSQRGNGLQRSVLMAIIRAQSEINHTIKQKEIQKQSPGYPQENPDELERYLYLIEEPEAFLHLSAQRELYYSIKELISDGSQALITTHSTLFMDEGDVEQIALLHRYEGNTSSTQSLEIEEVKENIGEILQISELMTGKVCCLVEGISDANALKVWFDKLGYNPRELGIYFIDMKGCKNAEYYANVKVIKDFNVNFYIVLDTDFHSGEESEERKKSLINEHNVRENQITILQKGEMENYFPIKSVEDVLLYDENSIDEITYRQDPKEAMKKAKEVSTDNRAKKYKEARDSGEIARIMAKDDLDQEIVDIVNNLVMLAGREVIEKQTVTS